MVYKESSRLLADSFKEIKYNVYINGKKLGGFSGINRTFDDDMYYVNCMEISIEFPINERLEAKYVTNVCVSPTREYEDTTEDYDWYDVDIPYDEIDELIELARANEIE